MSDLGQTPRAAYDDEEACLLSEGGKRYGFNCTRPKGHDGDHVAHGSEDQEVNRWPQ